ncbi:MAG: DUF1059 domain-containing protein [Actinomycetota bacterium]
MPEFRCVDTGASCSGHFKAATKEDLLRQVVEHFREKHGVSQPTQTLMNLVEKVSR